MSDLAAGLYCYTVTDANGCSVTGCITLTEPAPITASWCANCPFEITCHDACTGALDVTVYGGTAPYTFVWNDDATTEDRTGLCPGWYLVTITDANGCSYELATEPLENPEQLVADLSGSIDASSCDNACDGILNAEVTGGTEPYEIMWSNNGEGTTVGDVCPGTYTATITDARGCVITETVTIGCDGIVLRNAENSTVTMSDNATVTAYPNPFNVNSTIAFTLTNDDDVTLEVYTATGVKVAVLFDGAVKARQTNSVSLDGSNLADGMYIYRLVTSAGTYTGSLNRIK